MTHQVTMRHRLECGTELAVLVEQVAEAGEPEDPRHQAGCAYCQTTLVRLEQVWGVVREVAREEPAPPFSLVETVLLRIRRGLFPAVSTLPLEQVVPRLVHALLAADRGTTRIADAVVADIARAAARRVPRTRLLGRWNRQLARPAGWVSGDGIAVEVADTSVRITLQLALPYGASVPETTAAMRETVIADVEALTGLRVTAVDLSVDDVFRDEGA